MKADGGQGSLSSQPREYTGRDITVLYDRTRCVHFAECIRGLPDVFDVGRKPWIQPDNAEPGDLADVIERCPSGALHYELSGRKEASTTPTTVRENARGQILLRGHISVRDESGAEVLRDVRMSACGCGRSGRRPFCDSTCEDQD